LAGQILDDHGVAMILIPASSFEMGSELGNPDEQPVHTVQLDDFYIDQYLVPNARYQECVNAGVCVPPLDYSSATHENYYENPDYADYPVLYVTWEDAQSYCQWRDAHLPTEAEWEKAARGGLRGALYPWGNQSLTCERANFRAGSYCIGDTSAVGSYAPNKYGLYDMAGNAWEWVTDWYSPKYTADFVENPQGPETGTYRVLRGGSWRDSAEHLRVFNRSNSKPHMRYDDTGFRCARTP
jgi:formylglycine-generating enzyme required for sulfatase activity